MNDLNHLQWVRRVQLVSQLRLLQTAKDITIAVVLKLVQLPR